MKHMRAVALFTILIFLSALGGDSFAETAVTPMTNAPSTAITPAPATSTTSVTDSATQPTTMSTNTTSQTSAAAPAAPTSSMAASPSPTPPATSNMTPAPNATTTANNTSSTTPPAPPADTRPIVGKVIWVKGTFSAENPNKVKRALNKNDAIYLNDRLLTDKDSQAQIVFTDDTLMTFRPETNFYIDKYDYQPGDKKKSVGTYIMDLVTGGFRTITGLIAKANPSDYKVNTPVATIGVRGTDYTVMFQGGVLIMGFDHGTPCVSSGGGSMCLGNVNRYLQVNSAKAKPVALKQAPPQFATPLVVQPVNYTPPPISGGASTGKSTFSSGQKPAASPAGNQGSFCIK